MATLWVCQLLRARGCATQATTASARPTRSPLATRSVRLGSTALRAALTPAPRRVQLGGTAPGAAQRQIAPGLAMTARTCVASGVLAVQPQPQGVTHGLRVYPTRYCPAGSTSPEAVGCVSVSFYCASGSTAPTAVTIGYYSTPLDAAETARTGQAVCEKGCGAFHAMLARVAASATYGVLHGLRCVLAATIALVASALLALQGGTAMQPS